MSPLQNQIEVILQTGTPGAQLVCECFAGLSIPNPCLLVVMPVGGSDSASAAGQLARALRVTLGRLTPQANKVPAPCHLRVPFDQMEKCHGHAEQTCRKLLILVGDDKPFSGPVGHAQWWLNRRDHYSLLPVLPAGAALASSMPPIVHHINAAFWSSDPAEVVPTVLRLSGIIPEEYRLFISYRRQDAQLFVDQLFDRLARENFDVFVDRFRVDPGLDFQERLTEELADKAVVLLIESPTISTSRWVAHEIAFATAYRLGILALHHPDGAFLPAVHANQRIVLQSSDFMNGPPWHTLTSAALDRIVFKIKHEHARYLVRRRHQMRIAIHNELLAAGVLHQRSTVDGVIVASPGPQPSMTYSILAVPRPAGVDDHHVLHVRGASGHRMVLISPASRVPGRRRERISWLSAIAGIRGCDEGEIKDIAGRIATGQL